MTKNDENGEPENANEEGPKQVKVKIKGEPMDPDEISKKIEEALENAGLKNMDEFMEKVHLGMKGIDKKVAKAVAKIDKELGNIDITVDDECHHHHGKGDDTEYMKNVGVLNLKNITEEELDSMKPIKNMGVIIVPENLMGKVSAKIKSNVGVTIPYKEGWRLYSGHTEIDNSMLEALDEPIEFIQTGHMTVNEDVDGELLKQKIKAFNNYGHISVPDNIYGIMMAKCMENSGHIGKKSDEDDDEEQ
ncbi:MAG: hypothetical protein KAS67_02205 [Thermoplasmata archaeon]|nr:hypothetical protein [Thermoplasmata archaeon]